MFYFGCAGWAIPLQFSSEFPVGGSHLERYAQVLPCSEINSSFYRPHRRATWERWANAVPTGFRFAVKAPKAVTHESSLSCTGNDLMRFFEQALFLGAMLGPVLFQTSPGLTYDVNVARQFFSSLRTIYLGQVVIEPRHPSWFTEDAERLLVDFDIARVAADPAPTPKAKDPGGSKLLAYYRLHGSPHMYYSAYSEEALVKVAASLQSGRQRGDIWCVFDNTASGAAVGDALRLLRLLEPRSRF